MGLIYTYRGEYLADDRQVVGGMPVPRRKSTVFAYFTVKVSLKSLSSLNFTLAVEDGVDGVDEKQTRITHSPHTTNGASTTLYPKTKEVTLATSRNPNQTCPMI